MRTAHGFQVVRMILCLVLVVTVSACGALLLIPDLLALPSRIDGCPTVALLPGETVELTFVVIREDGQDSAPAGTVTWNTVGMVAEVSEPNANPVTVTANQVGFETITASYAGADGLELVDQASCIIGIVPMQPGAEE